MGLRALLLLLLGLTRAQWAEVELVDDGADKRSFQVAWLTDTDRD
jgi:hypothetical protein